MTDRNRDSGFSLVEVLVVLVIVTIATTVVVGQMQPPKATPVMSQSDVVSQARTIAMRTGVMQLVETALSASEPVLVFPDGSLSRMAGPSDDGGDPDTGVHRHSLSAMELR